LLDSDLGQPENLSGGLSLSILNTMPFRSKSLNRDADFAMLHLGRSVSPNRRPSRFERRAMTPSEQSEQPMTANIALWLSLCLTAQPPATASAPSGQQIQPEREWKELGRSLWFDRKGNRVVVRARVVLREGVLEHLMCKKGTKEHEAIVATDAAPTAIHAALLLTGAEVGHPVQFVPKFEPPAGTALAIEFLWRQDGQVKRSDARQWVRDEKTKAPLRIDWVFAGSLVYEDPVTKKNTYAADEGDLITVANFASAILDLPIDSSANDADRGFTANTAKIPPIGTEVFVFLSPRPAKTTQKPIDGVKRGAGAVVPDAETSRP
jgi:hypothetical protein